MIQNSNMQEKIAKFKILCKSYLVKVIFTLLKNGTLGFILKLNFESLKLTLIVKLHITILKLIN